MAIAGCAAQYAAVADREASEISVQKTAEVDQMRRAHLVTPPPASASPSPAAASPTPALVALTLEDAIRMSARQNRQYLAQRENLLLSALDLRVTRRDFLRPIFGGTLSYTGDDGSGLSYADSTTANLDASQRLWSGGTLTVASSFSLSHTGDNTEPSQSSFGSGSVSFSQPLLRGAGYAIAFEALTQAERTILYAARDFEQFRQTFVIAIMDQYYALLSQEKQLENTRQNIEQQDFARRQAAALYELGRGTQTDVFRAEQSYLAAQASLLGAEQAYERALDQFKIELGLPTRTPIEIEAVELPELAQVDLDMDGAVEAGLANRLDLATARDQHEDVLRSLNVARNNLLPSLSFEARYGVASETDTSPRHLSWNEQEDASVSLVLELPFDRVRESTAYRAAQIRAARSKRDVEETQERAILEIRDALRRLQSQWLQLQIEQKNIESLTKSVEKARLENVAGLATNRDIVEAQDRLVLAENAQLDRRVDYEIARLNLMRQLGLLFVTEEGLIAP